MNTKMFGVVLALAMVLAVASCSPDVAEQQEAEPTAAPPEAEAPAAEGAEDAAAAKLFQDACTSCHQLDRIEHHAKEELDEEPWDEVVTRMVEENGAKISPEDQKTILTYLQAKYGE